MRQSLRHLKQTIASSIDRFALERSVVSQNAHVTKMSELATESRKLQERIDAMDVRDRAILANLMAGKLPTYRFA